MKMSCIRRAETVKINADQESFLNMTYISRCYNHTGTYGTMGCKQRSYPDPYKSLRIRKLTACYMILNLRLIWVGIKKSTV